MLINTNHNLLDVNNGAFAIIPTDVLSHIFTFENLRLETDTLALVCKTWKEYVDSEPFRESIRPCRVMGIKQWTRKNPNILFEGKEHRLPRKFYKEYETKGGLCFFNPGRVKIKIGDKDYKLVVLNSLEAIASLFQEPNLKTCFTSLSWLQAIKEIRSEEAAHWVWLETKPHDFGESHANQQKIAKQADQEVYPERYQAIEKKSKAIAKFFKDRKASKLKQIVVISNAEDYVLGKFMAEAILGEREVSWDIEANKYEAVFVKNKIKMEKRDLPIAIGVTPSGLYIFTNDEYGCYGNIGFVCARKSFDTGKRS